MKYRTAAAFRQALEQRLLARARATDISLVRLRKTVVFDRLLARLAVAAPGRWVLKGALALDFRFGDRTRTTKDMDLMRHDDEEAATADLIAAQSADLGAEAAVLLDPVLAGLIAGHWDPDRGTWLASEGPPRDSSAEDVDVIGI